MKLRNNIQIVLIASLILKSIVMSQSSKPRIVTLGASVTEIVFALGAGDLVVARDSSSSFPPPVAELPDVGYFRNIGAEGVIAMNPTIIFAARDSGPTSQIKILEESGIELVHLVASPSKSAVIKNIIRVGSAINRTNEAVNLTKRIENQLAEVAYSVDSNKVKPRVIFLMNVDGNSARAAYEDTAANSLIELAGGTNPCKAFKGYKTISPEEVFKLNPDFILVAARRRGQEEDLEFFDPPKWLIATGAWNNGRVRKIDISFYLVFGPRIGDAVLELSNTFAGFTN